MVLDGSLCQQWLSVPCPQSRRSHPESRAPWGGLCAHRALGASWNIRRRTGGCRPGSGPECDWLPRWDQWYKLGATSKGSDKWLATEIPPPPLLFDILITQIAVFQIETLRNAGRLPSRGVEPYLKIQDCENGVWIILVCLHLRWMKAKNNAWFTLGGKIEGQSPNNDLHRIIRQTKDKFNYWRNT